MSVTVHMPDVKLRSGDIIRIGSQTDALEGASEAATREREGRELPPEAPTYGGELVDPQDYERWEREYLESEKRGAPCACGRLKILPYVQPPALLHQRTRRLLRQLLDELIDDRAVKCHRYLVAVSIVKDAAQLVTAVDDCADRRVVSKAAGRVHLGEP